MHIALIRWAPVVVQLPSHVRLFLTSWAAEFQAYWSFTMSQSLPKFMYTECRGLHTSMKLWVMPSKATQNWQVIVESSDKTWSTGGGNGKPLQYTCCEKPMNCILKRQKRWAPRCRDLVRVCLVIPTDVKGLAVWKQLVTETYTFFSDGKWRGAPLEPAVCLPL